MDVLVTGAAGIVGTALLEHLDGYRFTCLDVAAVPEDVADAADETVIADVTDRDAVREAVEGQDAVVHLARPTVPDELDWTDGYVANLEGTVTVYRAAVEAGVERIVYASSNHVVGGYEDAHAPAIYEPGHDVVVDHETPIWPDSMYAVTKVHGEALGRIAADEHDCSVYDLRICWVREPDNPYSYAEWGVAAGKWERGDEAYERQVARQHSMYLSKRDCAHLFECALRDESVEYGVFYGVGDNPGRWVDLEHTRAVLGFDPQDAADDWAEPP